MWKRFILWDYPRGGWQYDIAVGLILAFLFLTPRAWFRDQPRIPNASSVARLPSDHGSSVFFVDKELLADVSPQARIPKLTEVLRVRMGNRNLTVTQVEPIHGSEGELQGYMAFARP